MADLEEYMNSIFGLIERWRVEEGKRGRAREEELRRREERVGALRSGVFKEIVEEWKKAVEKEREMERRERWVEVEERRVMKEGRQLKARWNRWEEANRNLRRGEREMERRKRLLDEAKKVVNEREVLVERREKELLDVKEKEVLVNVRSTTLWPSTSVFGIQGLRCGM